MSGILFINLLKVEENKNTEEKNPSRRLPIGARGLMLIVVVLGLIAAGVVAAVILISDDDDNGDQEARSEILYMTSPVLSMTGRVIEKNDNSIVVENNYTLNIPDNRPSESTGGENTTDKDEDDIKKIEVKFKITEDTQVNRQSQLIPYLVNKDNVINDPETLSTDDINVGEIVSINSFEDLRIEKDEYEASFVRLPETKISLRGRITEVGDDSIKISAIPPADDVLMYEDRADTEEKEYTIKVTDTTEISQYQPPSEDSEINEREVKEFTIGDLSVDLMATVYCGEDVTTSSELTALYIQPDVSIFKLNE